VSVHGRMCEVLPHPRLHSSEDTLATSTSTLFVCVRSIRRTLFARHRSGCWEECPPLHPTTTLLILLTHTLSSCIHITHVHSSRYTHTHTLFQHLRVRFGSRAHCSTASSRTKISACAYVSTRRLYCVVYCSHVSPRDDSADAVGQVE